MIYLDYAASAPIHPRVRALMDQVLESAPGNASSAHAAGRAARELIEHARQQLAQCLHATPDELIWTSGATESNNLALTGACRFYAARGRHLVTSKVEHKSVIDTVRQLETEGWRVTWLVPAADGRVHPQQLSEALQPDTVLVSLMHVNNETGVINDVGKLARLARQAGALVHVDAAQSLTKCPLDVAVLEADFISLSAHKVAGPQGVGALYLRARPRARVHALMQGGGHERGMRPGTLPTHQIAGFGLAAELGEASRLDEQRRMRSLRSRMWSRLSDALPAITHNGDPAHCVANILNVSFDGVDGEALRADLPELAVASGSACTSGGNEPSYVLRALGRDDAEADASLRFSFGRETDQQQVDDAAALVIRTVKRLRALSPDWADAA